jgi:hypothetical protein
VLDALVVINASLTRDLTPRRLSSLIGGSLEATESPRSWRIRSRSGGFEVIADADSEDARATGLRLTLSSKVGLRVTDLAALYGSYEALPPAKNTSLVFSPSSEVVPADTYVAARVVGSSVVAESLVVFLQLRLAANPLGR